jgi:hypothetical protein
MVRGEVGRLWAPNGRHRLAAGKVLGLKQITALISPDETHDQGIEKNRRLVDFERQPLGVGGRQIALERRRLNRAERQGC